MSALTMRENNFTRFLQGAQSYLLLGFIIALIFCVSISTFYYSFKFLPSPAALPATDVVSLFNTTVIITGSAFFITQVLLFYFAFKYRTRPTRRALHITGKLKLELLWTAIPTVTFIFLFLWGQTLWTKIIDMPNDDAIVIAVMGEQFTWHVRYAGSDQRLGRSDFRQINRLNTMGVDLLDPNSKDDIIPLQMHVSKNRPVKISLQAKDVIHSFFIPYFRMKMDAVPGMTTQMHFTPTVSTAEMREKLNQPDFDYEIACAELCGRMHFGMKLILVVDEPAEFDKWYASQKPWIENKLASE
jgi:cytochrome c oxidase subunit 2